MSVVDIVLSAGLVSLLVLLGVVYPAVWSRQAARRKDAYRVLDLLLRRRRR
ncbi:hypothetical protein ABTZ99_12840 [Actinosynnema sp. NPDC002837]